MSKVGAHCPFVDEQPPKDANLALEIQVANASKPFPPSDDTHEAKDVLQNPEEKRKEAYI